MLDRRKFFAAAAAALAGGSARGGAPKLPDTPDLTLARVDPPGSRIRVVPVGWFDQKPGDRIVARWNSGRVEEWRVTGLPFVGSDGVPGVPVEANAELGFVEPGRYLHFDPATGAFSVRGPKNRAGKG